jgi:hypothetical protein
LKYLTWISSLILCKISAASGGELNDTKGCQFVVDTFRGIRKELAPQRGFSRLRGEEMAVSVVRGALFGPHTPYHKVNTCCGKIGAVEHVTV